MQSQLVNIAHHVEEYRKQGATNIGTMLPYVNIEVAEFQEAVMEHLDGSEIKDDEQTFNHMLEEFADVVQSAFVLLCSSSQHYSPEEIMEFLPEMLKTKNDKWLEQLRSKRAKVKNREFALNYGNDQPLK